MAVSYQIVIFWVMTLPNLYAVSNISCLHIQRLKWVVWDVAKLHWQVNTWWSLRSTGNWEKVF